MASFEGYMTTLVDNQSDAICEYAGMAGADEYGNIPRAAYNDNIDGIQNIFEDYIFIISIYSTDNLGDYNADIDDYYIYFDFDKEEFYTEYRGWKSDDVTRDSLKTIMDLKDSELETIKEMFYVDMHSLLFGDTTSIHTPEQLEKLYELSKGNETFVSAEAKDIFLF